MDHGWVAESVVPTRLPETRWQSARAWHLRLANELDDVARWVQEQLRAYPPYSPALIADVADLVLAGEPWL